MKKAFLFSLVLLGAHLSYGQKVELFLNENFQITTSAPKYFATSEKRDSLWWVQAYFIEEKSLALEGYFINEDATIPQGEVSTYHSNRVLRSTGKYVGGKRHGFWTEYHTNGMLKDSALYVLGMIKGARMQFFADGMMSDSMHYREDGSAVQISWNGDGYLSAVGMLDQDGNKNGVWKYYDNDGNMYAQERWQAGMRNTIECFDKNNQPLPADKCVDQVALPVSGYDGLLKYLDGRALYLSGSLPKGHYTLRFKFTVTEDGRIKDLQTDSNLSHQPEQSLKDYFQKTRWTPALIKGRPVSSEVDYTYVFSKK